MREVTVQLPGDDRRWTVHVHHAADKHVSASIAERGVWEPFETLVVSRLVRPGDLVVDGGANLGWYTLVAASRGAHVLAFEPLPANAALLRANVEGNGLRDRVDVHECALGRDPGTAELALSTDNQGDHRLLAATTTRSTVTVDVRRLDDVLSDRRPSLLKLDTQGSEVAILDGGRRAWAPPSDVVLVLEFWPYGLARCGASVDRLLEQLGELLTGTHRCFEIVEWRSMLVPRSLDDLAAWTRVGGYTEAMKGFTNLLALPASRVHEVADLIGADDV